MCVWIQFIIVGPLDLWERRQYIPSKHCEPFTQWCNITFQQTGILNL